MIRRLAAWVRDQRIRHHQRRVNLFGTAVLMAQINRDWPAADEFHRRMQAARAKRDALIGTQPRGALPEVDGVDWTLQTR